MEENPPSRIAILKRKGRPTQKKQQPDTDNKSYICQICNRGFSSSIALRSHCSATKHQVRCSVCDKGFATDEALHQHSRIHMVDAMVDISSVSNVEKVVTLQEVGEKSIEPLNQAVPPSLSESVTIQGIANMSLNDSNFQQMLVAQEQEVVQKRGLMHKSNTYTLLPDTEQKAIHSALLAACHTIEVLDAEQYTLQQGLTERKIHTNVPYSEFRQTPQTFGQPKRKIVAIDCEMVGLWKNVACVALLCAVDVLTGEILLNTYVDPVSKVHAWRSTVSGVTRKSMSEAIEQGQALRGWAAAREALWEYIDAETIIIGHALQNDLNVLGIFHSRIVDTAILASQAVFPEIQSKRFPESYGLKRLLLSWLKMMIQTGKKGHDCLEDTFATRELAIWCARNPDVLKSWGSQMRVVYETRKLALQRAREEAKKRAKRMLRKTPKRYRKVATTDVREMSKVYETDVNKDIKYAKPDVKRYVRKDFKKDGRKYVKDGSRKEAGKETKQGARDPVKVDTEQDATKGVKTDAGK
uniref:RNA exonuclease 3 n=1 Tax=Talaromyces marneffei PM1 TaxID=1077442 RepID=A0A093VJY7_TALMA